MEDFIAQRKDKVKELTDKHIDPYGHRFARTGSLQYYQDNYREGEEISVAGRIMTYRGHGKTAFCDLHDQTGKLQIYIRQDKIGEQKLREFKLVDIGDILGVKGTLFKTRTGEITVVVSYFAILSKAIRPLPEKWHGLRDVEMRYRQRYLDLLSNKKARDLFVQRFKIISAIRTHLDNKGFVEVETPMMQPLPGGAAARPFITHHTALDIDLYLRIAPELYLKRLLVGGMEKIYEINRSFRNEGISRIHNPEFTMLEVYAAYEDYLYMMDLTEKIISGVASRVRGGLKVKISDTVEIDFSPPWKRLSMLESIKIHTGIDIGRAPETKYREIASQLGVETSDGIRPAKVIQEIFDTVVEEKLIQPTFITDYPLELCPLSKASPDKPGCAERFELFINGMEIANAYSELNDPEEQLRRFRDQIDNDPEGMRRIDEDFIKALEYGMPPAGGLGIGIDRLVMVLTGAASIREVILFPQLKPVDE